jgi:ankyrin repeat protein
MKIIKNKGTRLFIFVILFIIFSSCGKSGSSPEEARIKLGQMGIKYSTDSFFQKVKENDVLAVKLFLDAGMNPKAKNKENESVITVAAENGRVEIMKLLLDKGGEAIKRDDLVWAVDAAAKEGHLEIIKLFYDKKGDVIIKENYWPFVFAAKNGHIDMVKFLFDKGFNNMNKPIGTNLTTPLMYVVNSPHIDIIRFLVEKGANPNIEDKAGETALEKAALAGNTKAVECFIIKGTDINHKSRKGHTALMFASAKGHYDTAKFLIEKGADINIMDNEGHTALDWAKIKGYNNIVQLIQFSQNDKK